MFSLLILVNESLFCHYKIIMDKRHPLQTKIDITPVTGSVFQDKALRNLFIFAAGGINTKYTETEFITGINRKETEVFHELYRKFYRPLVHFAMKYLRDSNLAEDCVQELLVSLWERRETFLSYDLLRYLKNTIIFLYLLFTVEQFKIQNTSSCQK